MDEVDAVPRPRRQRPKDSFQSELQAKLHQRKSLGLSAEVTDSDDDGLGSLHNTDYRRAARPGSAKYRSDRSPDLSRGLGTTTMRSRDLSHLLTNHGGHSDDDDEEVMAATLGKSKTGGPWQPPSYKTPSPKQDSKFTRSPKDQQSHLDSLMGRKTPTRESPKESSSRLDSIFGRKTPTGESPKDQSRLDSLYGRKTPTKDSPKEQTKLDSLYGRKTPTRESPKEAGKYDLYDRKTPPVKDRSSPGLTKEDIIFGRKTPTTDGRRLPGMDGASDKPWQPPNFRSLSPSTSPDHSRGSRGTTPTESGLGPINETPREKVTPRLQRGERTRNDVSPGRQVTFGERPKPQARSKIGDRKTSPTLDASSPTLGTSSMKRATPTTTMDLFGKTRSAAAQEIEDYMDSDKRGGRLGKENRKTPDSTTRYSLRDKNARNGQSDRTKQSVSGDRSPSLGRNSRGADGKRTPTGQKYDAGRKSPIDKFDASRKSPYHDKNANEEGKNKKQSGNQSSSLLDFLTGGSDSHAKANDDRRDRKLRTAEDDIDDVFATNRRKLAERNSLSQGRSKSPDQFTRKPTIQGRKSPYEEERRYNMAAPRGDEDRRGWGDMDSTDFKGERERSRDRRNEETRERSRERRNEESNRERKNDETSSVCEEIPSDPKAKLAKAEEKALKSGKKTSDRARTDNIIDTIAGAQTMTYIEPAKKVRPVTAEAKVQHRPKPRYGALPGSTATQTLQERQFTSTGDIRDAIYEEWYADRLKQAKRKKREEEKKTKEEEEQKRKAQEEKLQEAKLSYNAWAEKKKEVLSKEERKKRREEEKKREKEEADREEKRQASKKLFEHWKQEKDARTRHEYQVKKEKEDEERRIKEDEQYKKRKEKESAFRGWNKRKEEELKRQQRDLHDKKRLEKQKKQEEVEEQRRKERELTDKYNDWMEEKERQKRKEKHRTKYFEDDDKPAWSPASRTIPFGR